MALGVRFDLVFIRTMVLTPGGSGCVYLLYYGHGWLVLSWVLSSWRLVRLRGSPLVMDDSNYAAGRPPQAI